MSAYARDYVFQMIVKEDDEPIPAISKERLEEILVEAEKYPYRE